MIPPECLSDPCVGDPPPELPLALRLLLMLLFANVAAYNLIVGAMKFGRWLKQWQRR